jgi:hypothetical protein
MAKQASTYTRGEMNIQEQAATFELVMGITKWGSLTIGVALLFLVMWLCAGVGFLGSALTAVVATAAGVFFLRDGAEAH